MFEYVDQKSVANGKHVSDFLINDGVKNDGLSSAFDATALISATAFLLFRRYQCTARSFFRTVSYRIGLEGLDQAFGS